METMYCKVIYTVCQSLLHRSEKNSAVQKGTERYGQRTVWYKNPTEQKDKFFI